MCMCMSLFVSQTESVEIVLFHDIFPEREPKTYSLLLNALHINSYTHLSAAFSSLKVTGAGCK